jgi:type II secretory pathway component PulC
MISGRSILRNAALTVLAVAAGLTSGSPASAETEQQDLFNRLTEALRRVAEPSPIAPPGPALPPSQIAPRPLPEPPTHNLTLLGVVIGGDTRLALIQSQGGQELVPVGQSLAGYRLVDVEENQVTLEGQGGERFVLRMPTDGGAGSPAVRR